MSRRFDRLQTAFERMVILIKLAQIALFTVIIMAFITAQVIVMLLELLRGGDERRDH